MKTVNTFNTMVKYFSKPRRIKSSNPPCTILSTIKVSDTFSLRDHWVLVGWNNQTNIWHHVKNESPKIGWLKKYAGKMLILHITTKSVNLVAEKDHTRQNSLFFSPPDSIIEYPLYLINENYYSPLKSSYEVVRELWNETCSQFCKWIVNNRI